MISQLRGEVVSITANVIIVDVSGVGYEVTITPHTLSTLRVGATCTLPIRMIVREESMTLYGFSSLQERALFAKLQTVNGIGPKLALTILAATTTETLVSAIAQGDEATLVKIPGVGKKSAARLIIELGDKVSAAAQPGKVSDWQRDVTDALVSLGWSQRDASLAVSKVDATKVDVADTGSALRAALAILDKSGRA